MTCIEALVEENLELKQRVYNMNLYINWLEENCPATFKAMEDCFSGLPGYNEDICWVEIERNEGDWVRW